MSRRSILSGALGAAGVVLLGNTAFAARGGVKQAPIPDAPYVARLEIKSPRKFRILQLTDVHFSERTSRVHELNDNRTIEIMQNLVARAKPDLVMITGDFWRDNPQDRLEEYMQYAVKQGEALGVPWAFTWGNHDQLNDFALGHETLTQAANSLYRGATTDGNYLINIVGPKGDVVTQLVCLNSKVDGLGAEQQQWLRGLAADPAACISPAVPRFAFFHIPVRQYHDVWRNGTALGVIGETVCFEKDDGGALGALKAAGVRACMVGHDHVNDYSGEMEGVDLIYGRATGVGGYGSDKVHKGGKLYTLNCKKGELEWLSLVADGSTWRPKRGERIDVTDKPH